MTRSSLLCGLTLSGTLAACSAPAPPAEGDAATTSAPITLSVSAKATGAFGSLLGGIANEPDPTAVHMVLATTLDAGERVTITASGQVQLSEGRDTGPEGMTPEEAPPATTVFPLQEKDADRGLPTSPPQGDAGRLGALMGACVGVDDPASFVPLNADPSPGKPTGNFTLPDPLPEGHIPSAALFYIGSGPFEFTANESCVLFLGVNDAFAPNNSGAFDVTVSRD